MDEEILFSLDFSRSDGRRDNPTNAGGFSTSSTVSIEVILLFAATKEKLRGRRFQIEQKSMTEIVNRSENIWHRTRKAKLLPNFRLSSYD